MKSLLSITTTLLFFLISNQLVNGQSNGAGEYPCGTNHDFTPWLQEFHRQNTGTARNDDCYILPLKVHAAADDNGFGRASTDEILEMVCQLNKEFAAANIQFVLDGGIHRINYSGLYRHETFSGARDAVRYFYKEGVVNCFLVDRAAGAAGYYSAISNINQPGNNKQGYIVISNKYITDRTPAHEMGHYFGLPHTHHGWLGHAYSFDHPTPNSLGGHLVEKVDGSNCAQAGDYFCDTSPDYLSNVRWNCNNSDESLQLQKDPDGVTFRSDGSNHMSYSTCSSRFSDEQMEAMRAYIEMGVYQDLEVETKASCDVIAIDSFQTASVHPPDGAILSEKEPFLLEWAPVEGATHYFVELVQQLPDLYFKDTLVTENHITIWDRNLELNGSFTWRVLPLGTDDTCPAFTKNFRFTKSRHFNVYPNPVSNQQTLRVEAIQGNSQRSVTIRNSVGQIMQQKDYRPKEGPATVSFDLSDYAAGIYLVFWQFEDFVVAEKVVVTE